MNIMIIRKQNFFAILPYVEQALVSMGVLTLIKTKCGQPKKEHSDPVNRYYRVGGVHNIVWMHIQDGYGVFISEYVTTRSGVIVNLVDVLSRYYWYIEFTNLVALAGSLQNRSLHRCIGSVVLYNDICTKMPKWLEVHHKWWRFYNCEDGLAFVCRKKHQHFHNYVNSRKSHRPGVVIRNTGDILEWVKVINGQAPKLKKNNM